MTPDSDSGLDKQKILASINHPDPIAYPIGAPAAAASTKPPSTTRRVVASAAPPSLWTTHRSEIAAIVATFVSLIWIAAGVAGASGTSILIGILFGVAALAIWLLEVWSGD